MRLATVRTADGTRAARLEGDRLLLLRAPDVGVLLVSTSPASRLDTVMALESTGEIAFTDASFAPLVPHPEKIFCVGLNYRAHILEMSRELPDYPTLFAKFASGLIGAHDDLVLPLVSKAVDWEVELGVVIGGRARYLAKNKAMEAVAGYCLANDVSERVFQLERVGQFTKGKGCETFGPLGPWLVTKDEIRDPQRLDMWLTVNGESRQKGTTRNMVFGVAHLVWYCSQFFVLEPGDVIITGTPPGVGMGFKPEPKYLRAGDVVRLGIDGLGEQQQKVVKFRM